VEALLFDLSKPCQKPERGRYANIRAVGVERTTQATDLGQKTNPPVAEGYVVFSQRQLDAGFTTVEISRMAATIP